jgi:DNA-binding transcriptional MocR family regulator
MSVLPTPGVISLARGIPSPDMFPYDVLAGCARRAVERHGRVALNYGPPLGFEPLREWIASHHGTTPDRVALTPGSLIALNFIVRERFAGGGRAIVEAPTYDRMLRALADVGAEVVTVDRTDAGLDLDRLQALLDEGERPRLLYVLPTFHNPTGRSLTGEQRAALVDFAIEHELLIYEDDPYRDVRIEGAHEPYLHTLLRERGAEELSLFTSSFSKTVAPGLRVGYALLPPQLVAPIEALATRTYVSPPLLAQAQLLEFLEGGHLEPHLRDLGEFLGARRDALLRVLEEQLDGLATWTRPEGGYFLWLELPEPLDAAELNAGAAGAGVAFVPGAGFFAGARGAGTARLAFSYPSPEEIDEGARRFAALVREAV